MRAIQKLGAMAIVAWLAGSGSALAQAMGASPPGGEMGKPASAVPRQLAQVGFDQRLDAQLPPDATFRDETGRTVRLGDYFGSRPLVVGFVYFQCKMLCSQVLIDAASALRMLQFDAGRDFDVLGISFDTRDTPQEASEKKATVLERYKRPGTENGWHFLTGDERNVRRVTDAAGFRFSFDQATNQFAHASGVLVLTPNGRISRVFYGLEYSPRELRLALVEASAGKVGNPVDELLLYCYHYDPATGKYGLVVMNLIRLGGAVTVLALGTVLLVMWRRDRKQTASAGQV